MLQSGQYANVPFVGVPKFANVVGAIIRVAVPIPEEVMLEDRAVFEGAEPLGDNVPSSKTVVPVT
jgi:hypothetical protein